jgi:protocatechuate 3,4-dioxygenase beta subunit
MHDNHPRPTGNTINDNNPARSADAAQAISLGRPRMSRRAALQGWITGTASLLLLAACGSAAGANTGETAGQAAATAMARVAQAGPAGTGPMGAAPGGPPMGAGPGGAPVVAGQPATASAGQAAQTGAASQGSAGTAGTAAQQSLPACVLTPQQTEGPYFVDGRLNRADIRPDPVTGKVSEGVPLKLSLHVTQVAGSACTPLSGIYVDLWQCDALGVYSDVNDRNTGSQAGASTFLRGYQQTDEQGKVEFTTIYPGWYQGRAVHIHFKVRTALDGTAREQISQFYFDDALTDQVHALPPYASKGQGRLRNDRDGIYRNGGTALTVPVVQDGDGYAGTYNIGVQLS